MCRLAPGSRSGLEQELEFSESELSAGILRFLTGRLPSAFKEVEILFRSISRGILEGQAHDQHYLFTFVAHNHDTALGKVLTSKLLSFYGFSKRMSTDKMFPGFPRYPHHIYQYQNRW